MKYLLDTNIVSEMMKVDIDSNVEKWFEAVEINKLFLSDISMAELYRGYHKLPEGKKKRNIRDSISIVEENFVGRILVFDTLCARKYGELSARNEAKGLAQDIFDGLLLAVAERYEMTIVSRNERHFLGRTELRILNPFKPL